LAASISGGGGGRPRDDRRSPTSLTRRGGGPSRTVTITTSSPEASTVSTASPTSPGPVDHHPQLPFGDHGGDHLHDADSNVHECQKKEDRRKTRKQKMASSWTRSSAGDSWHVSDISNSVVVVEPQIDDCSLADQAANTSLSSRQTQNQEPGSFEADSSSSRRRWAEEEEPTRRKVRAEGQQQSSDKLLTNYLLNKITQ